jgi:ABC-2 type transport system permease protein
VWAVVWGAIIGLFFIATVQAFVKGFPTVAERTQLAHSMQAFTILIGQGQHLDTVAGFTSWRLMTISSIIGAIWAIRTSTGLLRGEEDAGRWELLLAGPTTPRRATMQALVGLGTSLLVMFAVVVVFTMAAGRMPVAHFPMGGAFLEAVSLVSAAAMFLAIGAVASQVAATAGQAAMLSSAVLGLSYVVRLIGDANRTLDWLPWLSPLGWIEELRPLEEPQPIALLPMLGLIALCGVLTVVLASRRDLNASVLREREEQTDAPRVPLSGPTSLAIRLTQTSGLMWIVATAAWVAVLGALTRSATSVVTTGSSGVAATLGRLGVRQASAGYLGLVFLMTAVVIALMAASQMVAVRDEEASGRLDNLLVRPVSRVTWLAGRVGVSLGTVLLAGLMAGAFAWVGSANQHTGVSPEKLVAAGLNVTAPALFVVGAGALVFGYRPQLTGAAVYGLVAWSFLVDLLAALVKGTDWLRDSSLFTHIALAPSVNPDWGSDAIMVLLAFGLAALGGLAFQRRDIEYA